MPSDLRKTVVTLLISCALPLAAAAEKPIFVLDDPRGDDRGDGALQYPLRYYDLAPGDLDITRLAAYADGDQTRFEATFAKRLRPTARRTVDIGGTSLDNVARLGFYTTNLDLYIDTDRREGSGGVELLPGRKATLDPRFAWERTVALTPRPFDARSTLKRLLLRDLRETLRSEPQSLSQEQAQQIRLKIPEDVETHVFFPNRVRIAGAKISFWVPNSFLGGPASPEWAYAVVVTGSDIDQRFDLSNAISIADARRGGLMILPIAPGRPVDAFGGGRDEEPLQPPIVDLIVPPGQLTQERILGDLDSRQDRPVVLPAVVPAELKR